MSFSSEFSSRPGALNSDMLSLGYLSVLVSKHMIGVISTLFNCKSFLKHFPGVIQAWQSLSSKLALEAEHSEGSCNCLRAHACCELVPDPGKLKMSNDQLLTF